MWPQRCRSKSAVIIKRLHYDQYGRLHKLLEADVILTTTQQQTAWSGRYYLSSHSGWKRPGIKSTLHYYQIIQEVLYQQWFRWHRRWYIVGWKAWQIWLRRRRWWDVWWRMKRYNRCSMKTVMMMNLLVLNKFVDFSVSYMWVWL